MTNKKKNSVTKTTVDGRREYEVRGKTLVWTPIQFDGDDAPTAVTLPLMMRVGKLLEIGEAKALSSNKAMMDLITVIAPTQTNEILQMDVNDFRDMFMCWLAEYNQTTGASLGEASASPDSPPGTSEPSNTTGGHASATD
ncbi:MAG: hypothetical protein LBN10_03385 [Propionibacteriaceae bacterium]|jgi:hypothetical protein|nr:hypothetical protein [Propionibacteriaceae bacterium]